MDDLRELSAATGFPVADFLAMSSADVERLLVVHQARTDFRRYREDQRRQREGFGGE